MKITKTLKTLILILTVMTIVSCCFCIFAVNQTYKVYAETEDNNIALAEENGEAYEVTPFTLSASLSLSINGGNGKVWATVKNDYTLFPGTISVIVQLYSSDTYTESYNDMTLVSANSIGDLNMGKTITTESETGGVEKFWMARMRYKIDKNSWTSKHTAACRISANGDFLGYI